VYGLRTRSTDNESVSSARRTARRQTRRSSSRRQTFRRTFRARCIRVGILGVSALLLALALVAARTYRTLVAQIDAHLATEWTPAATEVFATSLDIAPGMALSPHDLAEWLDELAYRERERARGSGEFAAEHNAITLIERQGADKGRTVRVVFEGETAGPSHVAAIEIPPHGQVPSLALGTPLLSARPDGGRRKHQTTPLAAVPGTVVQAVLAAEDHRFFTHPGIDGLRIAAATVTNLTGELPYLVGASTLTQQLIKNALLTPEQTVTRKLHEQALALLLERRLTKSRILELYLNEVYLGQHGSFAIHGVTEGARALFDKDLHNLSLAEAATLAGVIQAPQRISPARHPERAKTRRNAVLQAMVDLEFVTPDAAMSAAREPLRTADGPEDLDAPYFADVVNGQLETILKGSAAGARVETTLDVRLQRLAESAVEDGLAALGPTLQTTAPQVALVAVDPRSGAIRALVGGSSYQQSQFNRATRARRQPGSIVKPFVYLAALERARLDPDFVFTASSQIDDTPTTFMHDGRPYRPSNFGQVYDGAVTARLALARSRNVAAVKVAAMAGFQAVADLWAQASGATVPPPYPSLALGAFEATPLEVAAAYAMLANGGERIPIHAIERVTTRGGRTVMLPVGPRQQVVAADSAFLVTQMLRSVLDAGTGSAARRHGFNEVAAGKTGTTDDLRDAWFAGFTPTLLTVVWVGHDDNSPLGLTGAQAALPIWAAFMRRAHEGRPPADFEPPPGITWAAVDPVSGLLATPQCPGPLTQAFRAGTAPRQWCPLH
jgi:penicillin-binding protein 1B